MHPDLSLLDPVVALNAHRDEGVLPGDLGTIVYIYTTPALAYEVEFVNPDGSARALIRLDPDQLRHLAPDDVITTRPATARAA